MAGILNSAILNLAILDSAIIVCPLKVTHTCQDWFPPFAQKNSTHSICLKLMMAAILYSAMLDSAILHKKITPSFWINLMMAAIFNSTMLDSDTLLSSLIFTQKHSHSNLMLTQANSIWLKLIHSHSTRWWQPSWILPSRIQPLCTKNFTHSFWLNLMMAAILNSAMLDSDTVILDSDTLLSSLRFTQKHSHSTLTLTQTNSIWLKLIHSHLIWWWQESWNLLSWIWPSWIPPS